METINRINIRGTMLKMDVNEVQIFPKEECKIDSVRSTASIIRANEGKTYSVSVKPEEIIVTRVN